MPHQKPLEVRPAARALRADAARNRARILDAADEVFGARDRSFSTEQVAKRAGLGIGTVFRHFPTKEALLLSLLRVRLTELARDADALLLAGHDDGLFVFFARLVEQSAKKRAVVEALAAAGADVPRLTARAGRDLRAAVGRLLVRAQDADLVRGDVGVAEVLGLLLGMAHAAERGAWDEAMQRRTLAVLFAGLRRPGR